jgi:hypothetical protein
MIQAEIRYSKKHNHVNRNDVFVLAIARKICNYSAKSDKKNWIPASAGMTDLETAGCDKSFQRKPESSADI